MEQQSVEFSLLAAPSRLSLLPATEEQFKGFLVVFLTQEDTHTCRSFSRVLVLSPSPLSHLSLTYLTPSTHGSSLSRCYYTP
jgi:hypothetical protein